MDLDCENMFVCFDNANIEIQKKIPFKFEQITIDTFTQKELDIICNNLKEASIYHPCYYDTLVRLRVLYLSKN